MKEVVKYQNYDEWLLNKGSQAKDTMIGLNTPDKIEIKSLSKYFDERLTEQGLLLKNVRTASANPMTITEVVKGEIGRKSIVLTGRKVTVSINPETGNF